MFTLDQEVWNLLFGWLTNKKCLIPEGCQIPVEGILFYLLAIVLFSLVYIERKKILNGKSSLIEKTKVILKAFRDLE